MVMAESWGQLRLPARGRKYWSVRERECLIFGRTKSKNDVVGCGNSEEKAFNLWESQPKYVKEGERKRGWGSGGSGCLWRRHHRANLKNFHGIWFRHEEEIGDVLSALGCCLEFNGHVTCF
ncbi:hypothetical protein L6164_006702 [Bauhinia variegata]|uniref:Uncharacterized protein n=1 Tax=Bauhinia variegata TaxID=167791 RepID=A0ACB9PUR4_BAUVA|nr:hypothetical protein L6164_006702 [Bauhinia variegata]